MAAAVIARDFGATPWLAMEVALNPGVWLSGELLQPDVMALASGLLGILAYLRGSCPWRFLRSSWPLSPRKRPTFLAGCGGSCVEYRPQAKLSHPGWRVSVPVLL